MDFPPGDAEPTGELIRVEGQLTANQRSSARSQGNAVGLLTAIAFVAFLVVYALVGESAAGIAFWAVLFGLPIVVFIFSVLGAAWGRTRRDELLKVALIAVSMSEQRMLEERRLALSKAWPQSEEWHKRFPPPFEE